MLGDYIIGATKKEIEMLAKEKADRLFREGASLRVRHSFATSTGSQRDPVFSGVKVVFNTEEGNVT